VSSKDPWFPAGTADLRLTWAVYPVQAAGEFGAERNLELVLRVGDAVRRVPLGVQTGDLVPEDQSICNPSLKSGETVSQLKYETAGRKAFFAKRTQPDRLEISYFIDADPEERKVVATLPIPKDARITDAISDIRDAANEWPFDCRKGSSATPTGSLNVMATANVIDTADWKGAPSGSSLALRWTVDQSRAVPVLPKNMDPSGGNGGNGDYKGDRSKVSVPLELALTIDGKTHSVSLHANAGVVTSSTCGEVSFFWAGLSVPFQLVRARDGRLVLTRTGQQLYVFDAPRPVKVTHQVTIIAANGSRSTNKACSAPTL
jgi:hypothetical protein